MENNFASGTSANTTPETAKVKNSILLELETLTNQGKFEELVNLYIATFLHMQPDSEQMRRVKKKVLKKLKAGREAFEQANLEKIKMKVLDDELEMQINMLQNQLTRTIILLVSYMVKHGNDDTTKEVFRLMKAFRQDTKEGLRTTIEKGMENRRS